VSAEHGLAAHDHELLQTDDARGGGDHLLELVSTHQPRLTSSDLGDDPSSLRFAQQSRKR
jgi:hypothetical protein